ncbi:hypothetical protein YC2023_091917 [Brassica napus]
MQKSKIQQWLFLIDFSLFRKLQISQASASPKFKAAFVRKDYNSCSDLLSQLKDLLAKLSAATFILKFCDVGMMSLLWSVSVKGHETSGIVSGESVVEKAVGLEKDDEVANGDSSMENASVCFSLLSSPDNDFAGKEHSGSSNQAPAVDLESEQPTASASSTGDAGKIALGDEEANQPCSAADEKIPTPT